MPTTFGANTTAPGGTAWQPEAPKLRSNLTPQTFNLDLDRGLELDTTKEQFLERVRRLAVSHVARVTKQAEVAEITKETKPLQQQKQPQQEQPRQE